MRVDENPVLRRALGGDDPRRRVPSLVELRAPSVCVRLVAYAPNELGWVNYRAVILKIVK